MQAGVRNVESLRGLEQHHVKSVQSHSGLQVFVFAAAYGVRNWKSHVRQTPVTTQDIPRPFLSGNCGHKALNLLGASENRAKVWNSLPPLLSSFSRSDLSRKLDYGTLGTILHPCNSLMPFLNTL